MEPTIKFKFDGNPIAFQIFEELSALNMAYFKNSKLIIINNVDSTRTLRNFIIFFI